MNELICKVKRLGDAPNLPEKAHSSDAGWDLTFGEAYTSRSLQPCERFLFDTGICCAIPDGYYGHIVDRSGNATKKGLHVLAGIIDSSYRGSIKVCLVNLNQHAVTISSGDKIAQMLILPVPKVQMVEVDSLDETERGDKGFGSTDHL
jgi:dUTP pyrophosphatase